MQWLIAVLPFFLVISNGYAKYINGILRSDSDWQFLTKFCFLPDHGSLQFNFKYPVSYLTQSMLLYWDKRDLWESVYKTDLTCTEKEGKLDLLNYQIFRLEPSPSSSPGGLCRSTGNGTQVTCRSPEYRFKSARERWWYLVVSNCMARSGLLIEYELWMRNGDRGNIFREHFSADELYILEFNIVFFFLQLFLLILAVLVAFRLRKKQLFHTTYKIYLLSVSLILLSTFICCVTYLNYGSTGVKSAGLYYLSAALQSTGTLSQQLLVLLLSLGYSVTCGRLPAWATALASALMTALAAGHATLFAVEAASAGPGLVQWRWSSLPGYCLIGLLLAACLAFSACAGRTLAGHRAKRAFYAPLLACYATWQVCLAAGPAVCAAWVPPFMRARVGALIAKEEIESILAERDELYQLVRQNEDAEFQRFELEKRLTQTRDEMQAQASMAQQKVIALEEELEASLTKIAETSEERNSLKLRLADLEDKLRLMGASLDQLADANRQLARAKEVAERERVEEVEKLKMRMQGDLSHIQRRTAEEEAAYKRQIQQLKDNLEALQAEVDHREEVNCDFRDQLMRLENQLALETETKGHLVREAERQLERSGEDADRRLEAARDEARHDAEERLTGERAAWQAESGKELRGVQERLQRSVAHLEQELQCRDEELRTAQDEVRSKEAALKTADEEHKTELRERLRATLRAEKDTWERESAERWHRELAAVKAEAGRAIDTLQGESKKKGDAIKELEQELQKLASELDREREKSKAAQRDRVADINRLKAVAKSEAADEVRIVREQLEAAAADEVGRLAEQLRFAEETMAALRSEFEDSVKREAELTSTMDRTERALVNQANAECLKIAQVLGVTPRRVTPGGPSEQHATGQLSHRSHLSSPGHPVTSALANLEACEEELLAYCTEIRDESHRQLERLTQEARDRQEEATRLRHELAQEKTVELQALRERLIQDHMQEVSKLAKVQSESLEAAVKEKEAEIRELRAGMQKWKSETADRLAARLQDEFRREFDKKIRELRNSVRSKDQELQDFKKEMATIEQQKLSGPASANGLETPARAMLQLQERVKALRDENMSLRSHTMQLQGRQPPSVRVLGLVETPRLTQRQQQMMMHSSLTNLHQKEPAENYVHHLESNLRALEDRVRRAERQNEMIGKDRINSANKQQRDIQLQQMQQQQQQQQQRAMPSGQVSGRVSGRGGGGGLSGSGSFRAPSGHGSGR